MRIDSLWVRQLMGQASHAPPDRERTIPALHASLHARCYAPSVNSSAPAAQRAYDQVRQEILDGVLGGGSLLSEVEVATRLGVSRTPVHEAFLKLEAEDLLELAPRRGAVVVPIRTGEAADVLEIRHALEVSAVRRMTRAGAEVREGFEALAAGLLADQ